MVQTVFEFIGSYPVALAFVALVVGIGTWQMWNFRIRPLFIPKTEINTIADRLIAKHGSKAEEIAHIEEDRAWRYSDTYEQGKWRRVRRELWRRYRAGEWE